ncbi:hypothetical protein SteCoe_13029 [Stentor coeruleus]|uniref:Protein kinase domain-containing protein n=1 Tax=Stentor coeruleus TaxID=5963 RepID=A0A1R2C9H2_9CILI|nr:hypothetical protein SteCoe_13029 [Stentor coeruleus]
MDYFMFFRIERIIFLQEKWILQVEFSNWREGSGKPRKAIVKIVKNPTRYQEHEFIHKAQKLHPLFLVSYMCISENNYLVMLMEFCEKDSLYYYMIKKSGSFWTEAQIVYNMKKVAKALKILHENNIAHRDIKPYNIFVTIEGLLKVSDFGISKIINKNDYHSSAGTEMYKSPQLIRKEREIDPFKDDVWAFGISFAQLGLFKSNIDASRQDSIIKNYKSIQYSNEVKKIIEKCLQEKYENRITSNELYKCLKTYSKDLFKKIASNIPDFTEEEYFKIINNADYEIDIRSNSRVDFNLIKIRNEDICVICNRNGNLCKFRHVHKVHADCLLSNLCSLLEDDTEVDCWICKWISKVEKEKKVPQTLVQSLQIIELKNSSSLSVPDIICEHIYLMLGSTFMSKMYHCIKCQKKFCSMCDQSQVHFHCQGLSLFYKKHLQSVIISKSICTEILKQTYDVNIKKTSKKYGEPLKNVYVLKKTNNINVSCFRLQAFASLITEYVLNLYFWFIENDYAYLYFEYADGKTLLNEISYRKRRGIAFSNEEKIIIINNLKSAIQTLHENRIYIRSIKLNDIFIVGKKFKIANFSESYFEKKVKNEELEKIDWDELAYIIEQVFLLKVEERNLNSIISESWNSVIKEIIGSNSSSQIPDEV